MRCRKFAPAALFVFSVQISAAGTESEADITQSVTQQQNQLLRQQQLRQQLLPQADVHLPENGHLSQLPSGSLSIPQQESPCFVINTIEFNGESISRFRFLLYRAVSRSGYHPGMCLGAQGINHIMTVLQNAVIQKGYVTTRILAAPQELSRGTLRLTVQPGYIGQIRIIPAQDSRTQLTTAYNNFPVSHGDILNLRDLEQGLENLRRVPGAEAGIQIVPSGTADQSDVLVKWQQHTRPVRLAFNADNAGSKSTGQYQGTVSLSAANILGLSDLFYLSCSQDLGGKNRYTDQAGVSTSSGTRNCAVYYSVPWGNWLLTFNRDSYRYHQAVEGDSENYDYNGKSGNTSITVTRLLHRDARRKTSLSGTVWQHTSNNYINDAEIEVQRRRTAGWTLRLDHKEYAGDTIITLAGAYKRGTGAGRSLAAPEEFFGEGTSRMKIITADAGINHSFLLNRQPFSFNSTIHIQWNKTPLIVQDKIAIGGRYSVRGFDGELTLAAERGWYWRNDLAWQYRRGQQLYLAVDTGHVAGSSAVTLSGQSLSGIAVGLQGQFQAGGEVWYDFFTGKPLQKPRRFPAAGTMTGFTLSYLF